MKASDRASIGKVGEATSEATREGEESLPYSITKKFEKHANDVKAKSSSPTTLPANGSVAR